MHSHTQKSAKFLTWVIWFSLIYKKICPLLQNIYVTWFYPNTHTPSYPSTHTRPATSAYMYTHPHTPTHPHTHRATPEHTHTQLPEAQGGVTPGPSLSPQPHRRNPPLPAGTPWGLFFSIRQHQHQLPKHTLLASWEVLSHEGRQVQGCPCRITGRDRTP